MTMSFAELLNNTLSPVADTREAAQSQLEACSKENFTQFVGLLVEQLANETSSVPIRQSAGLMVKNALSAKEFERQNEYSMRWLAIEPGSRAQIKQITLQALESADGICGTTAAQIIAAIADIEIPRGEWSDLITTLLQRLTATHQAFTKKSILQCIGFICDTVSSDTLANQSNAILTAVAEGAKKEQEFPEVRLAALRALINSINFIGENFSREDERNYLMQIVCEATTSANSPEIQVVGFECLVRIVGVYYDYMGLYMQKALYGLTVLGMRHENESVVLQAIEFWSTICEVELERIYAAQEGFDTSPCLGFAAAAMPEITGVILWVMAKKGEDDDEDEWTPSMAAGTCLQLFASVTGTDIIQYVLPFIQENISNQDWRQRETACMALGCIIDGPETLQLAGLISQALPILLGRCTDQVIQVKDTAVWTLGRICEFLLEVIQPEDFKMIVQALILGLNDNPKIVQTSAWSIQHIARQLGTDNNLSQSCNLSPYFEPLITALMNSAEKNLHDVNARENIFEAVMVLVENSARDVRPLIQSLFSLSLQSLYNSLQTTGSDAAHFQNQENFLGIFQTIVRYDPEFIKTDPDAIMKTILDIISNAPKDSVVKEAAFSAVGTFAQAADFDFSRYMDTLMPFIQAALANHEDHAVCAIVLGVIGDISRAMGESIMPYCEALITQIGHLLDNSNLHRKLRPSCLFAIGDLSLAIGGKFEGYVHPAMSIISNISNNLGYIPQNTNEQFEYVMDTREAIADAITGICQGLKTAQKGSLLINYAQHIFSFVEISCAETEKSERYCKSMIGLLGDLADSIPPGHLKPFFAAEWIGNFIREVRQNKSFSAETRSFAKWTRDIIRGQL